jgi:hypothetical protein
MKAPRDEFRVEIARDLDRLTEEVAAQGDDASGEDQLDEILSRIQREVEVAAESSPQNDEHSEMAAVDAWAGLASYAVARFYAPASPWPWKMAGWKKNAPERLRRIADSLRPALERAARALGAVSWSVSVGFPWGVSISVTWP